MVASCLSWTCHHLVHVQGHRAPRATTGGRSRVFFCPTFCYRIRSRIILGARARATGGYVPSSHQSSSWRKTVPRTSPRAQAQGTKSEAPTPTKSMCTAGAHIIRFFRASYNWSVRPVRGYMRKCAIRISHSGCWFWLATEEVDYCAVSGSERMDPRAVVPQPPTLPPPHHNPLPPIIDGP
jgi:hypothetical protein